MSIIEDEKLPGSQTVTICVTQGVVNPTVTVTASVSNTLEINRKLDRVFKDLLLLLRSVFEDT